MQTPRKIAQDLGISVGTVRSHLKQIYSKAEVESAVQLLRLTHEYCRQ
jgi:DNA-binding CsgD family transcriptional regulator